MKTEQLKQILIESLDLAKDFEIINDIDPNLPIFTRVALAVAKRDFPILRSIMVLVDHQLSGDAILDLSRRVFEDMISLEYMLINDKDKMAQKFVNYSAVERWQDLNYLKINGSGLGIELETEIEENFQKVRGFFIYRKGKNGKEDIIAQSWSSKKLDNMVEELVENNIISTIEMSNLLQGYIMGNRKNHLSSEDTSKFFDKDSRNEDIEGSIKIGLMLSIVSYIRILSVYAKEILDVKLEEKLRELLKNIESLKEIKA
jgi:hypothetical protein